MLRIILISELIYKFKRCSGFRENAFPYQACLEALPTVCQYVFHTLTGKGKFSNDKINKKILILLLLITRN